MQNVDKLACCFLSIVWWRNERCTYFTSMIKWLITFEGMLSLLPNVIKMMPSIIVSCFFSFFIFFKSINLIVFSSDCLFFWLSWWRSTKDLRIENIDAFTNSETGHLIIFPVLWHLHSFKSSCQETTVLKAPRSWAFALLLPS